MEERTKVFCIGFNKTGTTTIKRCFSALGISPIAPTDDKSVGHLGRSIFDSQDYEPALQAAKEYQGFEDRPWNIWEMYRHLDERFPTARFILTTRSSEKWWNSVERWISITKPWMAIRYLEHLKASDLQKGSMIEGYESYNAEVKAYFAGRDNFLVFDYEQDPGWEPLCAFLGTPVPDKPFPHANRQFYDNRDRNLKTRSGLTGPKRERAQSDEMLPRTLVDLENISSRACIYCGNKVPKGIPFVREISKVRRVLKQRRVDRRIWSHQNNQLRRHNRPLNKSVVEEDEVGVVSWFWNPNNDENKIKSYNEFASIIANYGMPLTTVELATENDPFTLTKSSENLISVRSKDVMWQRERLLNLAAAKMSTPGIRYIVWMDHTMRWEESSDWRSVVSEALKLNRLVNLSADRLIGSGDSIAGHLKTGATAPDGAWAAPAEYFSSVGLYDVAVAGGGGEELLRSAIGTFSREWYNNLTRITNTYFPRCENCRRRMSAPEYSWHYKNWAQLFSENVGFNVRFSSEMTQSANSSSGNRAFAGRRPQRLLSRMGFDPANDLVLNEDGCWEWSSDREDLKQAVRSAAYTLLNKLY